MSTTGSTLARILLLAARDFRDTSQSILRRDRPTCDLVVLGVLPDVEGFSMPARLPDWLMRLAMLSPATAYFSAMNAVLSGINIRASGLRGVAYPLVWRGGTLYTSAEIEMVFLALWFVVPPVPGYTWVTWADQPVRSGICSGYRLVSEPEPTGHARRVD